MLEVADHGRVVVVYDDAEAPGEAESPNAAPEAPGEVESPRHRCEIETWSARNLSRFINICLFGKFAGCVYFALSQDFRKFDSKFAGARSAPKFSQNLRFEAKFVVAST